MRRRAKPAKAKVEAKLPAARKSRNNQGSKVRDLEKRLRRETARRERAERALLETLDRQRATGEILQVISRSSANAQPVFDAIVNAAARLLRTDGAISITRRDPGAFTPDEIALLQTFADQAVIAIENVRLFTELQEKNRALTHAHAQVTEALEQQTATAEVLKVISRSTFDLQPVLDTLIENAARLCASQRGVIMRRDGDSYHGVAFYNVSPELTDFIKRHPITPGRHSITARVALERRTIHVADLQADPEYRYALRDADPIRTELGVPIFRGDGIVGVIILHKLEVQPFTDKQIELVETFADQAVIAIENVRLFKELQERNRDLTEALDQQTATSEILRVIGSSPTDVQPVFDTIARSGVSVCAALGWAVFGVDGDMLRLAAPHGVRPERAGRCNAEYPNPLAAADDDAARTILERSVFHLADIEHNPNATAKDIENARLAGYRTRLMVPMVRGTTALGLIAVTREAPTPFSDQQVELLKTFADQAVIAIENVRLFKELGARNNELRVTLEQQTATSELLKVIGRSTFDLKPVFETLAENAVRLCEAEHAFIFGFDGQVLRSVATYNIPPALKAFVEANPIRPGRESGAARAAMERRTVHIEDIQTEAEYTYGVTQVGPMRTLLAIPMLRADALLGVIVITRPEVRLFTDGQIALMETFADQAAIAIENARLFREIEHKSRQLEVASQHKSEFLANMSHELRTPLNAIIGFSEVLTERMFGELNEKQDEYLKDIYASGQHLLSLINDILDLSKIEAGRMELEVTDFHLPAALDNALTLVRERAARRGIALQTNVDERLGEIQADERKIRQVVLNLLSNAIKFTPEGGRIEVGAVPRDGSVEVSVSDTGIGIAPEDQEAVFEEFRQVGTAEKKAEGTGLGLTLCRKFIELHGGRIWVKSQILPPWSSMNFRHKVSPSPVPSAFFSAVPTWRNSSNTASWSSGAMPIPVSLTDTSTDPSRGTAPTSMRPPSGVNLIAFESRFNTTCRIFRSSA